MDGRKVRPLADFLREQGSVHEDLSTALAGLVDDVVQHGKPGALTLKITVKPAAKGGDDTMVIVTDQVVVKAPAGDRAQRIFFALPDGGLTRKDPRQMEFSDVADANGEVI